jgi:NAD(P)-dependent dehydrogenase (short-subunit alcohol dehydrogenase family)
MKQRKTALVTGATGGIGYEVARRLYQEGYDLILPSRQPDALAKRVDAWRGALWRNPAVTCLELDLSTIREDTVEQCLGGCPPINLLVFCHGAAPCTKPLDELSMDDWHVVWNTDVSGVFSICRYIVPHCMLAGGSIIILSSFHCVGTYPDRVPYATAKTALTGLARGLCCSYARHGIRTNVIAPGQVANERTYTLAARSSAELGRDVLHDMLARTPARQLVNTNDIVETVLWLTRTPSVNGQTILLDHGASVSLWHQAYL